MGLFLHKDLWQRGETSTAEYEAFRGQLLPFLHPDDSTAEEP